jgi:hypothetical protein
MQTVISVVALGCAILSFVVFLVVTLRQIPDARSKADQAVRALAGSGQSFTGVSAKDVAELVKALASLADSLVKAGPALWSLMGSLLFLLIAALAAGLIVSIPETPKKAPSAEQQQAKNIGNQANAVGNASNSVQN